MALMVGDKQSNTLKHFCKICKKGFGCGRALGGHMRAHGLGDDGGGMDDDDDAASDWDGGGDANVPPSSKKNYALRTNSNRLKNSIRTCENCGTVFWSWKSFLEHGNGKCSSDDTADDSFVSSDGDDMSGGGGRRGCGNSSKRKRSVGTKVGSFNYNNPNCSASNEDEDLANCLMMLSSATVEADESSALAMSKDEERRRNPNSSFMVPTSQVPSSDHHNKAKEVGSNNNNNKGLFECKACKKVFNSHQALGGHRASHKKVKGCFAARLDNLDDTGADDDVITYEDQLFPTNKSNTLHFDHGSNNNNASSSSSKRKSKVHECSICHRVFSSGQALGGHKRCHWITSNAPDTSALARFQQFQEQIEQHMKNNEVIIPNKFDSDPIDLKLDLNLPAPPPDSGRRTLIYLPSWVGGGGERVVKEHKEDNISQSHQMDNENNGEECKKNSSKKNRNIRNGSTMQNVVVVEDDEADSKVKLAKLSELKDMTEEGSSSAWLQVGIGSSTTTDAGTDP